MGVTMVVSPAWPEALWLNGAARDFRNKGGHRHCLGKKSSASKITSRPPAGLSIGLPPKNSQRHRKDRGQMRTKCICTCFAVLIVSSVEPVLLLAEGQPNAVLLSIRLTFTKKPLLMDNCRQ